MNKIFAIIYLLIFSSQCFCSEISQEEPVTLVMFGATGDLAARKLFPALYHLSTDKEISDEVSIIAVGRRDLSTEEFQNSLKLSGMYWDAFKQSITYQKTDFSEAGDYLALKELLKK